MNATARTERPARGGKLPATARRLPGRARTLGRAAGLGLVLLALAGAALPAPRAHAPQRAAQAAEGPDPIDFAIVVDLSKSLSDQDLAREVEAAALLSQGEISERSRAAVIGFGSAEKSGQSAVRQVCGLIAVSAAGRQELSDCVQQLGNRAKNATGPGTDFPAAIRQAVNRLTKDGKPGTPKVVFLLTDGKLDVGDSPEYGTDTASRQANAAGQLTDELARARRESVQIWPLGFGSQIDSGALDAMARGGFRNGCANLPGATPKARVVADSAQIDKVLQETFAAARCAQVVEGERGKPPGDLSVTIPPIATDGSLTVSKHDRKVSVTYFDPNGDKVPTSGSANGSSFEVSGQDGPVEALRVKNPMPGKWRVHVEAPEGHQGQDVVVRAIWQGRLRSAITLDPASPTAGEQAVVEMRMQTRRGVVITDQNLLKGIQVGVKVTGRGFEPVNVRLKDDGTKPDAKAGDARFTGTLAVPDGATGDLAVVGEMSAPGVTGDQRPLYTALGTGKAPVEAGLTVERSTVHPGGTLRGTLDVTNNDTVAHTLTLGLADQPSGTRLAVDPVKVRAEPGSSHHTFTVSVGADAPLGELGGGIVVTDADDRGRTLDQTFLDALVEAEPTWWDRWWWAVLGAAALLLAAAAVLGVLLRARKRLRDLTGVKLELRRGGTLDTLTVRPGQSGGGNFHFTVERASGSAPKLHRVTGSGAGHRLSRTGAGVLALRLHRGRERALAAGEVVELDDGLELLVHDNRRATSVRPPRGRTPGGTNEPRRGDGGPGGGSGRTPRRPFGPRSGGSGGASDSGRGAPRDPATGSGSRQYDANF
ncbi:VWA domain-containing protein [Streptomyces sp. NPDC058657]|uniref:VWA domain-containing protein n=1 Tax=unclassified Streptomyces TaxID=2593676 RepID=UPI00365A607F